jgi:guanosine-3',5'-bis(diphosphate) 3'-pyrophosphohydrolase
MNRLIAAIAFAADKHRDQRRKDAAASPYINHPIALAIVLANEVEIDDERVLIAAVLHDTLEDTETTEQELVRHFGQEIAEIVLESVTTRHYRRRPASSSRTIAPHISRRAKLVKLADKICNLRDIAHSPPYDWSLQRRQEYFDWAKAVIDQLRGVHPALEHVFDQVHRERPASE